MLNDLANRALAAVVRTMGEPVVYTHGQDTAQVKGVFQASHIGLDPDTGMQVNSTQPILLVDGWGLAFDPHPGDTVEVRDTTYRVRDAKPDGHTGWLLMLHRTNQ